MLARLLFKYILVRAVAFTYTHRCKISHVTSCRFALPVTLPIQALPIAIADCHFDSGFDHVTSHVATKLLLACAPLAMWELPTSRLPVPSATAIIFQVNTNSRLLCNSTYIGFTKIRCQHRPPQFQSMKVLCFETLWIHYFNSHAHIVDWTPRLFWYCSFIADAFINF